MTAQRLTIAQMRAIKRRLEEARADLQTYLEPDNQDCSVGPSCRTASREYLETWVMPGIEGALVTIDTALEEK